MKIQFKYDDDIMNIDDMYEYDDDFDSRPDQTQRGGQDMHKVEQILNVKIKEYIQMRETSIMVVLSSK